MELFSGAVLAHLVEVFWVNIILSGDNAVVIAMAVRTLEGTNRRRAVLWGAAGAVVLRLIFAAVIAFLLHVPLLQVVGGVLLIWIAWQLVRDGGGEGDDIKAGQSTWEAIRIIIVADVVMSLDNVVALVQAAEVGSEVNYAILGIGLITTVPLVVFGATLLTSLLNRFPVLVYLGASLLVYLAIEMFFEDVVTHPYLEPFMRIEWIVGIGAAALFVLIAWLAGRKAGGLAEDRKGAGDGPNAD
ncbi:MAG TPA: TerC family protein [Rubrobacter sp.]|nr:TerC family protein [Rubrobacter sp.]